MLNLTRKLTCFAAAIVLCWANAAGAPLSVPENTGLLSRIASSDGRIVVCFETNPDTLTAQDGDIVVNLSGFTLVADANPTAPSADELRE